MTFSKQTAFNKTFCICHRKGATKPGKQLTLFLWQASKALQNMTATTVWSASEESSIYSLLCTVPVVHRLPCISWPSSSLWAFLSFLPPSHFLIYSLLLQRALRCAVKVTLTGLRWTCIPVVCATTTTTKQTLLQPCKETSIYPDLDLAVIVQTDGQSKAHHTPWARNKLKSARLCISFQNQCLGHDFC